MLNKLQNRGKYLRKTRNVFSLLVSILIALSLLPLNRGVVFAEERDAMQIGIGDIADKEYIYMGVQGTSLQGRGREIKWRILTKDEANNGDPRGVFLLSEELMGSGAGSDGGIYFDNTDPKSNQWQGSDAQQWCKSFSGETITSNSSISLKERNALLKTVKNDSQYVHILGGLPQMEFVGSERILNEDIVFFLSAEEVGNRAYFADENERKAKYNGTYTEWWLRSPARLPFVATDSSGYVQEDGKINIPAVDVPASVRPACNLDKNKVLFTTPAEDGKQSGPIGENSLQLVGTRSTTEWKLTLKDNNRTFALDNTNGKKVSKSGDVLSIPYKNATTGEKEYISAIIEKNDGTVTHYGNLKQLSAGEENGEVTVKLPSGFDKATRKLYIINEQLNGNKKTDYASEKLEIDIIELSFPDKAEYDIPEGRKGDVYIATSAFNVTGGIMPYTFTVDPAIEGLTINAENKLLYTRPSEQNATTATIKVTDSATTPATANIVIDIGRVSSINSLPTNHVMTFDSNGGSGVMQDAIVRHATAYTLPSCMFIAPSGKTFDRWEVGGSYYDVGQTISNVTANFTIKAVWKAIPSNSGGGGGSFASSTQKPSATPLIIASTVPMPTTPVKSETSMIEMSNQTKNVTTKRQQISVLGIGSDMLRITINGQTKEIKMDAKPFISAGRAMVPVRYVAESLGMKVKWIKGTMTVTLEDGDNTVEVPINTNKIITISNNTKQRIEHKSDIKPIAQNGRIYLTISNLAKVLGLKQGQDIKWDAKRGQVTIIKEVDIEQGR